MKAVLIVASVFLAGCASIPEIPNSETVTEIEMRIDGGEALTVSEKNQILEIVEILDRSELENYGMDIPLRLWLLVILESLSSILMEATYFTN